jgi:uncharacterized protein
MARRRSLRVVTIVALGVVTALCSVTAALRLRLDPNVAALLPERGDAAALRRYLRAFGGGDLALVLVEAPRSEGTSDDDDGAADAKAAAEEIAARLAKLPSVRAAASGVDASRALDPWLAWRHAGPAARARLAAALTPEGMRERLRQSRALLLAPGAGAAAELVARDPLRLAALLHEAGGVGGGFHAQADGAFASDDGRARLVLVFPEGQALRGVDAKAFVAPARAVLDEVGRAHPKLRIGLTGGHAIAEATERMLIRDMTWSGTLSMALAALAFVLTFRRIRALVAVMPPLLLGTVWTAGLAALLPTGLSAIAVAFMSVVIGVGVDTGVHVYAELIEARREGLAPAAAARRARERTMRPVLIAAATAAAAFGALGLSQIGALRQLGLLCAAGEVLTAIAIVAVTPEIGAWLERGPARRLEAPWARAVGWLTLRPARAGVLLALVAVPLALVAFGVRPAVAESIVALRPSGLEPLAVQERVYHEFGGRRGQWVLLVADVERQAAMARADALVERLGTMPDDVDAVDGLSALIPAERTQLARFAERDGLDLPAKAAELERALGEVGFAPERFAPVLEAMRHAPRELVTAEGLGKSAAAVMLSRYLGRDEQGGADSELVAIYVLPRPGHEAAVEAAVHDVDARAAITGYTRLEGSLRAALSTDLPRIGLVATLLVVVALGLSLRRALDVALAAAVVACEIGIVLFLIRVLHVPLHAYDALVLPVLLGITVDEAMFLLHRARAAEGADVVPETLASEGPAVAATALTTAAGFAGLVACEFDGLRHLGMVGAIGSIAGLLVAFIVVPAGLRLAARRSA